MDHYSCTLIRNIISSLGKMGDDIDLKWLSNASFERIWEKGQTAPAAEEPLKNRLRTG